MSDVNPDSKDESKAEKTEGVNFSERYSDVMGKVNESLSKIVGASYLDCLCWSSIPLINRYFYFNN